TEDQPAYQEHRRKMQAGQVSSIEYRILTHSGETLWISDRLHPIWDESLGRVVRVYGSLKDISERKRTEEILKVRLQLVEFAAGHSLEELLPVTIDAIEKLTHSQIGFFHFVENNQFTISLQQWSTRTRREFCDAQDFDHHYPLERAGVWADVIRERRPIIHNDYAALEHRKGLPEGHAVLVRELVFPIQRAGQIVAIVGVGNKVNDYNQRDLEIVSQMADLAWDIIERKRTEQRLFDEQFFSQGTIDVLPDHLCVLDQDGVIMNVNRAWRAYADANPPVPPNYCLGMNYLAVCDHAQGENAAEAAAFALGLRTVMQGECDQFSLVYPCHHPSGEEAWFNARITRFAVPGGVRIVVVHESITEVIKISKSMHLLTAAVEQSPASIIITDPHGRIEYANPKFCELTGYSSEEVIGNNPRILKSGFTPGKEYTWLWKTILSGQTWQGEFHNRKKNGDLYWEQASISPVLDSDGRISHFLAVKEDITQRKMAEEALRESEARFRTLIEQTPAAIGVSREGKTVYANLPYLRMFGFNDLAEIQGRPILE
ncbi:PAS domain S-box protein, partial [bacterium]|nr:PAS domain S-box protein [bacterium]